MVIAAPASSAGGGRLKQKLEMKDRWVEDEELSSKGGRTIPFKYLKLKRSALFHRSLVGVRPSQSKCG
jgi:hypothetical protein